jgi:uncharacterized protein YjiK
VARFNRPQSIATDSAGNIYVADTNNSIVRKITPAGMVTTLPGLFSSVINFFPSQGVATDSADNVYVTSGNTIRKIAPAGVVTTLAGVDGLTGSTDGAGAAARFNQPKGLATDSAGNVYVADTNNNTIRKVTPAGAVTTFAGAAGVTGSTDGNGATARFNGASGVATDSVGNVYVADTLNGVIRKITPGGLVSTLAATTSNLPTGVATDSTGNVYYAGAFHTVYKITLMGTVATLAGTAGLVGSTDGTGAAARFSFPQGVATDSAGNVYVADTINNTIRKITPAGVVSTLAGTAPLTGSRDSTGAAARFTGPGGITADSAGNIYVGELGNNIIRKITPAGVVTTFAGTAGLTGSADGTGATASFDLPRGVASDNAGNVYVADTLNHTIRKITSAGVVTTFAGTAGLAGSGDATGAAARFFQPEGVATDSADNVYVADAANRTIRKITPTGVVTTLAGTVGLVGSTDGTGAAALFALPFGIATDSAGNIYVADSGNSNIRKITPAGIVSTLAGTAAPFPGGSTDGTGLAASFYHPQGIATDSAGNVYVADTGFTPLDSQHIIRKITPAGVVTTIVGVAGRGGFAPGPLPGLLSHPKGVVVSGTSLYITLYSGVAVVSNVP